MSANNWGLSASIIAAKSVGERGESIFFRVILQGFQEAASSLLEAFSNGMEEVSDSCN